MSSPPGALSVNIAGVPETINPVQLPPVTISGTVNDPAASVWLELDDAPGTQYPASVTGLGNWFADIPASAFTGATEIIARAERNGGGVPSDLATDTAPVTVVVPALDVEVTSVPPLIDSGAAGFSRIEGTVNDPAASVDVTIDGPTGLTWAQRASGVTSTLYDVTYGAGQFVAVGTAGVILTSPDGVVWAAQTSGITSSLHGVTYGDGQFVVVGAAGGVIRTSPDGVVWTAQTSGASSTLNAVTYGDGQFVAVGRFGGILTSPDGVVWTAQASGVTSNLFGVIYGGGQFAAVGDGGVILTSPDGVVWTAQASGITSALNAVTYGDGQFVAVGVGGVIRTSPDGVVWAAQTSGTTVFLDGVTYGAGQFVAVGDGGVILTATPSTFVPTTHPATVHSGGTWQVDIANGFFAGAVQVTADAERDGGVIPADRDSDTVPVIVAAV